MAEPAVPEKEDASSGPATPDRKKQQRKGILSRVWNGVFGGGREDYEKRLQHLSKEEAAVHARMKRRAQGWRAMARNFVVCSLILEITAVVFAITTTRSLDLSWQKRALLVLPMFLFPGLSYVIYSALISFTGMRDRKDQKTLENLRAERQAKINELKELTNYYTTQQLIQRYDVDPAAKAAATTVLAAKLEADFGMKLFSGDEPKPSDQSLENNDVELVSTVGLRQRKHANTRGQHAKSSTTHQFITGASHEIGSHVHEDSPNQNQTVDEHYKSSSTYSKGWIPRIAAMLVGEDPTQCYALICRNCHMHNGLARKEDFPYITYYCPHCRSLNEPQHSEEQDHGSGSVSREVIPCILDTDHNACGSSPFATISEAVGSNSTTVPEQTTTIEKQHAGGINEKEISELHID